MPPKSPKPAVSGPVAPAVVPVIPSTARESIVDEFVYVVPWEKYVYRRADGWALHDPVGKDGITNHLLELGYPVEDVGTVLRNRSFVRVYGYEMAPGKGPMFYDSAGQTKVNMWVPPTLVPKAGVYPRIQRVLDFVTKRDAESQRWLKMWMAWKVQNPGLVPKVCVVITTEPGGGKGTLAAVMSQMLGPENCDTIKREHLENKFNARWVQKLFVLGDEILSNENLRDISNSLKIYIDSNRIEIEAKHQNQRTVENHLAWIFASNDPISPVIVEKNDRRYSVFSNHDPLTPEYRAMFLDMFESDRSTPTPGFLDEIAALYHELLEMKVDRGFAGRPFDNEDRKRLIEANLPGHQMFFKYVDDNGIDDLLEELLDGPLFEYARDRKEWDFGSGGIVTRMLYRCYVEFCKRMGAKSMRYNKFGQAAQSHRPAWEHRRLLTPSKKRPNGYVVPRTPKSKDDAPATETPAVNQPKADA